MARLLATFEYLDQIELVDTSANKQTGKRGGDQNNNCGKHVGKAADDKRDAIHFCLQSLAG